MFEAGILQSGFWHRFAMTAHSPVGMYPDQFKVKALTTEIGNFANNDLDHEDPSGADHDLYKAGLNKSLYNFMHGICLDHPLQNWFDRKVPPTTLPADLISNYLTQPRGREVKGSDVIVWTGGPVAYDASLSVLIINTKHETRKISCSPAEGVWLEKILSSLSPHSESSFTYQKLQEDFNQNELNDFTLFWYGRIMEELKEIGLLVL
jgi:hypothetical protein